MSKDQMTQSTYQASYLKQMMTQLLTKITDLEKKYSSKQNPFMPHILEDITYSQHTIQAIKNSIRIIDKDIAPKFDQKNKPSLPDHLSIIVKLLPLRSIVQQFTQTRAFLFYSTLSSELLAIINLAYLAHGDQLTIDHLIDDIKQDQDELFHDAYKQPGTRAHTLLNDVKHTLQSIMADNHLRLNKPDEVLKIVALFSEKKSPMLNISVFFAPTITHPMMYELIEMATLLLTQLPLNLQELGHFFNPEALSINLHDGILGAALKKAFGMTFKLDNKPEPNLDIIKQAEQLHLNPIQTLPFTYDLIFGDDQRTRFNIAIDYAHWLPIITKLLLTSIENYFNDYDVTPHVQSELTRIQLIQAFMHHEIQWLDEQMIEPINGLNAEENPLTADDLQKEIGHIQSLLKQNSAIQKIILDKKISYTETPAVHLLTNYPELNRKLRIAQQDELNTSWTATLLPHFIIGSPRNNAPVDIIPVTSTLHAAVDKKIRYLNDSASTLQDYLTHYQSRLDTLNHTLVNKDDDSLHVDNDTISMLRASVNTLAEKIAQTKDDLKKLHENHRKKLAIGLDPLIASKLPAMPMEHSDNHLMAMQSIIAVITQELSLAKQAQIDIDLSKLLTTIYELVQNDSKRIPLETIQQLPGLNPPNSKEKTGFDLLLQIIDQDNSASMWRDYFLSQKRFFNFNAQKEFNRFKEQLLLQIQIKQETIPPHRQNSSTNNQLCQELSHLLEIAIQNADIMSTCERNLQTSLASLQAEHDDAIALLKQHEHQHATEAIAQSDTCHNDLPIRLQKRKTICQDTLLPKLDEYWKQRTKTYYLKDLVISQDKLRREHFITVLKHQLNSWYLSGDSTLLMKTLRQGLADFPGHHLSAVINQIMVKVIKHSPKEAIADITPPDTVESILNRFDNTNTAYAQAIKALYSSITTMKTHGDYLSQRGNSFHGQTMAYLANKLNKELRQFVVMHQHTPPSPAACQLFIDSFRARLHSQDNKLNQHTSWKPLLGNITIGIVGLGIVLGIKLAWSKITTGRFCFFFEQTDRHKQMAAIEKQVLMLPAVMT